MNVSIICARGGSKRLPRKNIKAFCGIPLVAWAVIQSKTSVHVDETFVSTDDDEIEQVCKEYGATVIRRPYWPDADQAAANRPMLHAIGEIKKIYDDLDILVSMLPTNPLVVPGDIDRGIELCQKYGCDTIRPLIPLREMIALKKTHPWRFRTEIFSKKYEYLGEGGNYNICRINWYDTFNREFSDLDAELDKMENWPATEGYFFPVQYWQYSDVDTAEEFEFAELLMKHYILKGKGPEIYSEYWHNKMKELESDEKNKIFEVELKDKFGNMNQQ